jgi:hypothetical protein
MKKFSSGKLNPWAHMKATDKAKYLKSLAISHNFVPSKDQPGGNISDDSMEVKSPANLLSKAGLMGAAAASPLPNLFHGDQVGGQTESELNPEANVPKIAYEPSGPAQIENDAPATQE